jgi:AGZA family xanthine/uracil permease-like MFS transporter
MVALIPVVAILPILLYIGMLIGAQAFQETPKRHVLAIVLALTPHLVSWGKLQIDNVLGAAGTSAGAIGLDKLAQNGVLYHGLEVMGVVQSWAVSCWELLRCLLLTVSS